MVFARLVRAITESCWNRAPSAKNSNYAVLQTKSTGFGFSVGRMPLIYRSKDLACLSWRDAPVLIFLPFLLGFSVFHE